MPLPVMIAVAGDFLVPGESGWWRAVAVIGVLLLTFELSSQIRLGSDSDRTWTRELTTAARQRTATERRLLLTEQNLERRRGGVSPETSRTFRLFSQLVRAEEATRAQMAAELHDAVAQTLSRALVELRASQPGAALNSVAEAEEQLRGVMARIRPPELTDGDLAQAIADLAGDLDSRYGVSVKVSWPAESVPLPTALATTVYRFAQEALMNAVAHADGIDVTLDVTLDQGELHAVVCDGGPGFDPDAVVSTDGRHVGLRLARERARLAGGVLEIDSQPGRGTRATLRLPLAEFDHGNGAR